MIVFDVETSGLNEDENGVLGIGAIRLPGGETFYHEPRLIDELKAHPKALEVNGFTEEEVRSNSRIAMADTLKAFTKWGKKADDMILAGWNTTFDYRFLSAEYERCGLKWPFGYRIVDIQSIAYTVMRIRDQWTPMHNGYSTVGLNYTLKWLKLPPEPDPHNALTGAQCNVDALMALSKMISVVPLIDGDEPAGFDIPEQLALVGPAVEVPTPQDGDGDYEAWLEKQH
ncbi:MAG: 3'-5' exonuclease [Gammaproteobacteria bacterium]|nr:3'-5' exonuclease [Gammaproteobacteria bacterium]